MEDRQTRATRLIQGARAMIPRLIERADEAARIGAIPPATLAELHEGGYFDLMLPPAYGGGEPDLVTALEVAFELGRGCGSTAWVYQNNAMHNLIVSYFPKAAQDEFWGDGHRDRLIATGFKARHAKCEAVDGGYLLSGHWEFNSGIANCDAVIVTAAVAHAEPGPPDMRQFIVYLDDYVREDDWNTIGLRATGSTSGKIEQPLFVPEHRSIAMRDLQRMPAVGGGETVLQGAGVWDTPWHRIGMFTWVALTVAPALLGCAQAAIDWTIERMQTRTTLFGDKLKESQAVQLRLAEAQTKVNMGRFLVFADGVAEMEDHGRRNVAPDLLTRGKWRSNAAYAVLLARDIVTGLQYRGGAHGIARDNLLANMFCDVVSGSTHAATDWDINGSVYGKALLGIDTSTLPMH